MAATYVAYQQHRQLEAVVRSSLLQRQIYIHAAVTHTRLPARPAGQGQLRFIAVLRPTIVLAGTLLVARPSTCAARLLLSAKIRRLGGSD
jgi:hypothetical protein